MASDWPLSRPRVLLLDRLKMAGDGTKVMVDASSGRACNQKTPSTSCWTGEMDTSRYLHPASHGVPGIRDDH